MIPQLADGEGRDLDCGALGVSSVIKQCICYDPQSGLFHWLERPVEHFKSAAVQAAWNRRYAGKRALTSRNSGGYHHGTLFGVNLLAHRAAWVLHYGAWPTGVIDHINHDRGDNRIDNLRDVSQTLNRRNCRIATTAKSGFRGVSQRPNGRFRATMHRGHIGTFDTAEEAYAARLAAEEMQGFHPNHGKAHAEGRKVSFKVPSAVHEQGANT